MIATVIAWDAAAALWVQQHLQSSAVDLLVRASMLVSSAWVVCACVMIAMVWCGWRRTLVVLVQLGVTGSVLWHGLIWLKAVIARPRPFLVFEHVRVLGVRPETASFPSLHAAEAWMCAVILWVAWPHRRARMAVCCWAALVAFSRVYCAVHYVSDVVVGMWCGVLAGIAGVWISQQMSRVLTHPTA